MQMSSSVNDHEGPVTYDNYGRTPLHMAVFREKLAVAGLLLERGADLEARDKLGRTPLHEAAFRGKTAMVKLLLAHGADLEARDKFGRTPLREAAFHGETAMVKLLLARGADPKARDNKGNTAARVSILRQLGVSLVTQKIKEKMSRNADHLSWAWRQAKASLLRSFVAENTRRPA